MTFGEVEKKIRTVFEMLYHCDAKEVLLFFTLLSSWMSEFLLPLACEVLLMTVSFAELFNCATGIEIHFRFSSDSLPANILQRSPDIEGSNLSLWVV